MVGFTFNYLTPRPPAIKAALESERVKFSFSHTEALTGGHELTLPATTRMRWFPNTGQPLSLTNNRQVLTRVRLLEKHHANVFAEAACSVDGTNWESQILPLSANVTKGNLSFQIPEQIEVMAKKFAERAKDNKGLKLNSKEYTIKEIAGDTFSGSFVQFEIEGGFTQTMFMIGDAEGIWNGQFRGTKESWAEALSLLKKLKKKG